MMRRSHSTTTRTRPAPFSLRPREFHLIIPRSDVDGPVLLLSLSDDQDEIVLRQLIVSNLLIEGVPFGGVGDGDKAGLMEGLTNLEEEEEEEEKNDGR